MLVKAAIIFLSILALNYFFFFFLSVVVSVIMMFVLRAPFELLCIYGFELW